MAEIEDLYVLRIRLMKRGHAVRMAEYKIAVDEVPTGDLLQWVRSSSSMTAKQDYEIARLTLEINELKRRLSDIRKLASGNG